MEEIEFEVYEPELKYDPQKYPLQYETSEILKGCFEVYNHLGRGFAEATYKEAIEYEFNERKISYERKNV